MQNNHTFIRGQYQLHLLAMNWIILWISKIYYQCFTYLRHFFQIAKTMQHIFYVCDLDLGCKLFRNLCNKFQPMTVDCREIKLVDSSKERIVCLSRRKESKIDPTFIETRASFPPPHQKLFSFCNTISFSTDLLKIAFYDVIYLYHTINYNELYVNYLSHCWYFFNPALGIYTKINWKIHLKPNQIKK